MSDEEAAEDDDEEDERVLVDDVHCILLPSGLYEFSTLSLPFLCCAVYRLCGVDSRRRWRAGG